MLAGTRFSVLQQFIYFFLPSKLLESHYVKQDPNRIIYVFLKWSLKIKNKIRSVNNCGCKDWAIIKGRNNWLKCFFFFSFQDTRTFLENTCKKKKKKKDVCVKCSDFSSISVLVLCISTVGVLHLQFDKALGSTDTDKRVAKRAQYFSLTLTDFKNSWSEYWVHRSVFSGALGSIPKDWHFWLLILFCWCRDTLKWDG